MNDINQDVIAQRKDNSFLQLIAGTILTAGIIYLLAPVIPAVIISFLLFIAFDPLTSKLCRKGFSRNNAALIVLTLIIGGLSLSLSLYFPSLVEQLQTVMSYISKIKMQLADLVGYQQQMLASTGINVDLSALQESLRQSRYSMDIESLQSSTETLASFISVLFLIPIILFFLLKDYRSIRNWSLGLLPNRYFELGWLIYYRVSTQLHRYFRGLMLQVLILCIITSLGFYLIGIKSFLVLGAIAGILVVIPYLGMILGIMIPALVVWSSMPGDYLMIWKVVLVVCIAHLHDQVVVVPTVIASAVNLHPLVIILGIVLAGFYMGILGMIIVVPLLAALKIILESLVNGLHNRVEEMQ